jgi:hypothetical protein
MQKHRSYLGVMSDKMKLKTLCESKIAVKRALTRIVSCLPDDVWKVTEVPVTKSLFGQKYKSSDTRDVVKYKDIEVQRDSRFGTHIYIYYKSEEVAYLHAYWNQIEIYSWSVVWFKQLLEMYDNFEVKV